MSIKIIVVSSTNTRESEYWSDEYLESTVYSGDSIFSIIDDPNTPPEVAKALLEDLTSSGWVNIEDIKNREDRVKVLKEYLMIDRYQRVYSNVDIDHPCDAHIRDLATGEGFLVQKLSSDHLTGKAKERLDEEKKKNKAKVDKARKASATKKKNKKAKDIEKAKKVLKEAGIKI
jgi:hypothetical protein